MNIKNMNINKKNYINEKLLSDKNNSTSHKRSGTKIKRHFTKKYFGKIWQNWKKLQKNA